MEIDYYFTSLSPFTYLGHQRFLQIAKKANATVHFKPVKLGEVFAESGATPLPQRPKSRLDYRLIELGRWAKKRGLPINKQPSFFPTSPVLADKCVIALQASGVEAGAVIGQILAACWEHEKDIADESTLKEILNAHNIDADALLASAQSPAIEEIYTNNTHNAIKAGVLGTPAYVYGGEQFWGQDRLELLEETLG